MFPSGPTVGPAITPWPLPGSVNVQRIEPSEAMAVIVLPEATYTVPSGPTVGPPSPPMNGTVQRSEPSGLRE